MQRSNPKIPIKCRQKNIFYGNFKNKTEKNFSKKGITYGHAMPSGLSILTRNLVNLSPFMTFTEMLLEQAKIDKLIKLPAWLFQSVCCRKSQAALTTTEQQRYICAFNMINADGTSSATQRIQKIRLPGRCILFLISHRVPCRRTRLRLKKKTNGASFTATK